MIAFVLTIRN